MNRTMLLHLIRKDLRWRRRDIAALWSLLALYCAVPVMDVHAEIPFLGMSGAGWSLLVNCLLVLAILGLMTSLQLDFIHADHPRSPDAFLQSRPVAGLDFAAAKVLVWSLVAALPALFAVLLRLTVHRLDLRPSDYERVGLRNAILLVGIFGLLAMMAVVVRQRRVALAVSMVIILIVAYFILGLEDFVWENLSDEGLRLWALERSRSLVAWSMIGASGFALMGAVLTRARLRAALQCFCAVILLAGIARLFWPINLTWRDSRLLEQDSATLQRLQKQTSISVAGALEIKTAGAEGESLARPNPLPFGGWEGPEFPEVVGYEASAALATGQQWNASRRLISIPAIGMRFGALVISPEEWEGSFPPLCSQVPPEAVMKALGLPPALGKSLRDHAAKNGRVESAGALALTFRQVSPVEPGISVQLSGSATLQWYRPVILATLPLQRGSSYLHDGRRVWIRGLRHTELDFTIHLTVERAVSMLHSNRERAFDSDPALLLWIANPARQQIAFMTHADTLPPRSEILDVETIDVHAAYHALGEGGRVAVNQAWLDEARLYVVGKVLLGQTRQTFSGELKTSVPPPPHTTPHEP